MLPPPSWSLRFTRPPTRLPDHTNTKAGKEQAAKAEAAGFQVITQTLHDKAAELAHRVKSHPLAAELFEEGRAEVPLFDIDEATALQVKRKLDWLRDTDETVVDLERLAVVDQAQPTLPNRWPTSNITCRPPTTWSWLRPNGSCSLSSNVSFRSRLASMSWTTTPWPKAATYAARLWIWWPNAWRSTTGPAIPMTKCKPFHCPLGLQLMDMSTIPPASGRQRRPGRSA